MSKGNSSLSDYTRSEILKNDLDLQDIKFFKLESSNSRGMYRKHRVKDFPMEDENKKFVTKNFSVNDGLFYNFGKNYRNCGTHVCHWQLRHVVKTISAHSFFFLSCKSKITQWDCACSNNRNKRGYCKDIMDLSKRDVTFTCFDIFNWAKIGTLLGCGDMVGMVYIKNIRTGSIIMDKQYKVEGADSNVINSIDFFKIQNNSKLQCIVTANDNKCRVFDINKSKYQNISLKHCMEYKLPINGAKMNQTGNLLCLVGDFNDVFIIDLRVKNSQTKIITKLKGHKDCNFTCDWAPNISYEVATGSQDDTVRIWDLRNNQSSHVIKTNISPPRSVKYSHDGKVLSIGEAYDYIHIYPTSINNENGKRYNRSQVLDVFGSISGITFSPCDEFLYVGCADRGYKSVLEFQKVNLLNKSLRIRSVLL